MEILSNEISMRLSIEMDSLMSVMHSHMNRAIFAAISDRVILEIQNPIGTLSSGQKDTESCMSTNNQDLGEKTNGLNNT